VAANTGCGGASFMCFGSAAPCRWDAVILPDRGTVGLAEEGRSLVSLRVGCIDIYKHCEQCLLVTAMQSESYCSTA
jgi:hypothetical protein